MKISSDHVIGALIGLARACISNGKGPCTDAVLLSALSCPPDAPEQNCNGRSARLTLKKPRYPQDV